MTVLIIFCSVICKRFLFLKQRFNIFHLYTFFHFVIGFHIGYGTVLSGTVTHSQSDGLSDFCLHVLNQLFFSVDRRSYIFIPNLFSFSFLLSMIASYLHLPYSLTWLNINYFFLIISPLARQ